MHILAWAIGLTVLGMALGALYQAVGTRRDRKKFPPPGRLVDLSTHRLHLYETGENGPTVVLEAGLMSTVLSWSGLQRELSRAFRVVSYDRAGLGWSDLGPMPRTADRIVEEFDALLERAGIPGPYVLVGHSFGGLTVPLFAARFPEKVAGVVLVDPVAAAEWNPPSAHDLRQTRIGATICRRAAWLARIGFLRFVAALLTTRARNIAAGLVRLISRGAPEESGTVSSPWFAALPPEERDMAAVFWIQPKFALTIASQLENLRGSAARVSEFPVCTDKPVVILSARTAPEHRQKEHAAMAARLPQGQHLLVGHSNHWIMQEDPELVIREIRNLVERSPSLRKTGVAAASSKSE